MFRVTECIGNSLGSHETFHCLYRKNQRSSRSDFRFVKKIILRNRSYVNMALNSRGRRMSEKIKMVIVQYLLMHLSVETIRSKLKNFHSYVISRQGLYYFIKQWRSGKGLRRTRNNSGNSVKLKSIHLKFMDMWLAKNNELTTEMLKQKLFEVFGISVSPSLIRKRRSELGWKTVVSKTCQLISHKNKKVCTTWFYIHSRRVSSTFLNVLNYLTKINMYC